MSRRSSPGLCIDLEGRGSSHAEGHCRGRGAFSRHRPAIWLCLSTPGQEGPTLYDTFKNPAAGLNVLDRNGCERCHTAWANAGPARRPCHAVTAGVPCKDAMSWTLFKVLQITLCMYCVRWWCFSISLMKTMLASLNITMIHPGVAASLCTTCKGVHCYDAYKRKHWMQSTASPFGCFSIPSSLCSTLYAIVHSVA